MSPIVFVLLLGAVLVVCILIDIVGLRALADRRERKYRLQDEASRAYAAREEREWRRG